jgi:hypothetical protein
MLSLNVGRVWARHALGRRPGLVLILQMARLRAS